MIMASFAYINRRRWQGAVDYLTLCIICHHCVRMLLHTTWETNGLLPRPNRMLFVCLIAQNFLFFAVWNNNTGVQISAGYGFLKIVHYLLYMSGVS
jgi:hypothetical protein